MWKNRARQEPIAVLAVTVAAILLSMAGCSSANSKSRPDVGQDKTIQISVDSLATLMWHGFGGKQADFSPMRGQLYAIDGVVVDTSDGSAALVPGKHRIKFYSVVRQPDLGIPEASTPPKTWVLEETKVDLSAGGIYAWDPVREAAIKIR